MIHFLMVHCRKQNGIFMKTALANTWKLYIIVLVLLCRRAGVFMVYEEMV